jgi:hypothetical protein
MNKISAQDRSALIRLASSLPAGSPERRTILASFGFWQPIKDGWKHVDREILAHLVWDDKATQITIKDHEPPDPEMIADGIPELVKEYNRAYDSWESKGWWPRTIFGQGLILTITNRARRRSFEAHFTAQESQKAFKQGELAAEIIRDNKYPRWMKPV